MSLSCWAAAKKLCAEYDVTPVAFSVESFLKNQEKNKKLFEFGKALRIRGTTEKLA